MPREYEQSFDALEMYMKEMGKTPLLTAQEEIDLFKRMEVGQQAWEELQLFGKNEDGMQDYLQEIIEDGKNARDHMIRANTRLVVDIAANYLGRELPFEDIIAEGNIGLIKAVNKYDYRRGYKFSTYATWWIRQTITRALGDESETGMHLSTNKVQQYRVVRRAAWRLVRELGREPNEEEIANDTGFSKDLVHELLLVKDSPIYLDGPVGEHDESVLGELMEDPDAISPEQQAIVVSRREHIDDVFKHLTGREQSIIMYRYGFEDGDTHTLEEVAKRQGVTRERIRQIEGRALRKLRSKTIKPHIEDFKGNE